MDYETAKRLSQSDLEASRAMVAQDVLTAPEILYFLADDVSPTVRQRIAANTATPHQADLRLVSDGSDEVRMALAHKIAHLLPNLPQDAQDKLRDRTLTLLRKLAEDQAMRVRAILSDALHNLPDMPSDVVNKLARDVELRVAEPVLRQSPVLTDDDLMEIIHSLPATGAMTGVMTAIARRPQLSPRLSDEIAARDDVDAITALLSNASAHIREATLDKLLDRAPEQPVWHKPFVERASLPLAALKRLAGFVSAQLLQVLSAHPAIDTETAQDIAALVRTRLMEEEAADHSNTPEAWANSQYAAGTLTEPVITEALESGERAKVLAALAVCAKVESSTVSRIVSARSAKGLTALVWRAGLSMRLALQMQTRLAGISPQQALYPKNGADFPLSEEDLRWQLEFFGVV